MSNAIQIDGASEFMGDFEIECRQRGVELFVLAPKLPNLNGRVGRIDKTWRAHVCQQFEWPSQVYGLRPHLQDFQDLYPDDRPHEGIDLPTPWGSWGHVAPRRVLGPSLIGHDPKHQPNSMTEHSDE